VYTFMTFSVQICTYSINKGTCIEKIVVQVQD
jgi:hypothetical protein